MLEMAILETQIFKHFWGPVGGMPRDPSRKLAASALVSAPPVPLKILDPPLFGPCDFFAPPYTSIGQNGWTYDVIRKSLHLITARGEQHIEGRRFIEKWRPNCELRVLHT